MAMEVAVLLGETGETVSIYEPGQVVIFRKMNGNWKPTKKDNVFLSKSLGLNGLREKMAETLGFLDDCKVFTARSVTGVPYYELEKAGCSVWEFEGKPDTFLDYIVEHEEEEQIQANAEPVITPPKPVETSNGCYSISLKEIQSNNTGFTSKQVLLPFLRQGTFYTLEVVCSHVPPWLEVELADGSFSSYIEKLGKDELKVVIAKKTCDQF